LETTVDAHGVGAILDALCDICGAKGERVLVSYGDKVLAHRVEAGGRQFLQEREKPQLAEDNKPGLRQDVTMPRGDATALAAVREPTLTIVCGRCGRDGRYLRQAAHRRAWRRHHAAGPSGDARQSREGALVQRLRPMQSEVRGL
jgi:hypothetical protein